MTGRAPFMRSTFGRFVAAVCAAFTIFSTHAGTLADYPEYPYAQTSYNEPLRGQFHFSSQSGWMNDINGPVYYRGTYHMFYQHNPHGLGWDTMHWGHATSTDLVHWVQQPVSLEPGVHDVTLFSGSAWVDTANVTGLKRGSDDPILLYTNTNGVSIAYSTDGAKTFKMFNGGAKVVTTPGESRDPKVQWDAQHNRWVMVIWQAGAGMSFYTSTNLLQWSPVGSIGASWAFECPDLYMLPLDGNTTQPRWVLQDASGRYVVGALDANSMFATDWSGPQWMDKASTGGPGPWYAPQTFNQLPGGRVVQVAWQADNRGWTWTGNASFPVELTLKTYPEGVRVARNPVAEINGIRGAAQTWGPTAITPNVATNPLAGIEAELYELRAEFDLTGATAGSFGFQLHRSSGGTSDASVMYDIGARTLQGQPMPPVNNRVKIRVLVDRGQLEVFGDDGHLVLSRNVDFNPANLGIGLVANGGNVSLVSLTFNRLNPIWGRGRAGRAPKNAIVATVSQGRCVDRDVASGRVQTWDCLGGSNQAWTLDSTGAVSTGGVCLELPPGQTANHTLVQVAACNGGAHQKWRQGNFGSLVNLASGRCLDADVGDYGNGRQLQVYDCVGGPNQSWVGPTFTGAATSRISWSNTASCVDRDVASGRVQIWSCNGGANQSWTTHGSGELTTGGLCMQLMPGQTANRSLVSVAACTGATNQAWSRVGSSSWMNLAAGRCLDLDAGDTTNGRQLQVWDCVGGPNQTWLGPR